TTMHWVANAGNINSMRILLKIPSNVRMIRGKDQFSFTPLHRAAWNGHEEVVQALIQHGAWVSARARRYNGVTPLHLAVSQGHENVARLLIQSGCTIYDEDDQGETA
ncbi:ankyrin repeat-containing domain protein, partial [Baffinella frigidus]